MIWTDINDVYYPPSDGDDKPPPIPRNSYIEMDFQKDKARAATTPGHVEGAEPDFPSKLNAGPDLGRVFPAPLRARVGGGSGLLDTAPPLRLPARWTSWPSRGTWRSGACRSRGAGTWRPR